MKRLQKIGLKLILLTFFFTHGEYGLSSMGNYGQNYVALLQGSEIAAELHSRNLILGINGFRISILNVQWWPNG